MIRRRLCMGSLALVPWFILWMVLLLPVRVEAAEAKTIYNSPYVSFSPDGRAFTTCNGDRDYTWYDIGTRVSTGILSSLREPDVGEHYYKENRYGDIPVGYWEVEHRTSRCIHDGYPESDQYHGVTFHRGNCHGKYNSAWIAYCADCGEMVSHINMYMSRAAAESIEHLDIGSGENPMAYYYLCPYCSNLEQGSPFGAHRCRAVSSNQYKIIYRANTDKDLYGGYMDDSYHMYDNATVYEGNEITPVTHLTENGYSRTGYVFKGWNTKPDGSGMTFEDRAEIHNLSAADWKDESTWTAEDDGTVTLYAQWHRSESTLVIDANGGSYQGMAQYKKTGLYGTAYRLRESAVQAPVGCTVSFETNGGRKVNPITGILYFQEWERIQPFAGRMDTDTYYFSASEGNEDIVRASYRQEPVELPPADRQGWSFGGWYYDPDFTLPAGGAGDRITVSEDVTLYAQWVDLRLNAVDNYRANDGKGAVDLSWSQADRNNKTYRIYQKRESGAWLRVNSADDIGTVMTENRTYTYEGTGQRYIVPSTGLYTICAMGAQGQSFGSSTGGYGGMVSGTFWLQKGEVLTCTVGGRNGYNGGGRATDYGNGGGMTSVVSEQRGILMIAGGGGGASPGGNGGSGGSMTSVTDSREGENGMAGGGGGYQGGSSGERIVHYHTAECYRETSYTPELGNWQYFVDSHDGYSDTFTAVSARSHTRDDDPYHIIRAGWSRYYWDENMRWNVSGYRGIPTNGNTELSISVQADSWGSSNSGLSLERSEYRILDQSGRTILSGSFRDAISSVGGSAGSSWENPDGSWGGSPDVRDFEGTFHFKLPAGTTTIFLDMKFAHDCGSGWFSSSITGLTFGGGKLLTCGYEEGQILSSKPAYGGSSYVSPTALLSEARDGVRSGDGMLFIQSKAVGYQDTLELTGVTATDDAAPDKIADHVTEEALDDKRVRIIWQEPVDRGTTYYHKAESYLSGSTSVLCESNITSNTLVSGVRGYYYVVDEKADTTATERALYVKSPHTDVNVTQQAQYLHVAAVDVAGNVGPTVHIPIRQQDILWKLYTRPLEVKETSGNVYPAQEDRCWYVKADGKTPFTLENAAYMEGTASEKYQLNETIYETLSADGSRARNIIRTPSSEVSDRILRTNAEGLIYSVQGKAVLQQYPYSYTVRSDYGRELVGVQKFTVSGELSGQKIQVIPIAEADRGRNKVYSAQTLNEKNKIYLIADGEAPVIQGMELLEHRELIDRREGPLTLRAYAADDLSGVRKFYVQITNTDNGVSRTYTPGKDGSITVTLTKDEPIFSGNFNVLLYAEDNVGNENSVFYGTTEFALESSVERILEPHDPIFKCGESGILNITTWGYADRVEVIFPESMTALDPGLNKVYDYTEQPEYKITEQLQFMVPLYTPENQNLSITVCAYKGDKKLEDHPAISIIGVSGTVLEELRTRLR